VHPTCRGGFLIGQSAFIHQGSIAARPEPSVSDTRKSRSSLGFTSTGESLPLLFGGLLVLVHICRPVALCAQTAPLRTESQMVGPSSLGRGSHSCTHVAAFGTGPARPSLPSRHGTPLERAYRVQSGNQGPQRQHARWCAASAAKVSACINRCYIRCCSSAFEGLPDTFAGHHWQAPPSWLAFLSPLLNRPADAGAPSNAPTRRPLVSLSCKLDCL